MNTDTPRFDDSLDVFLDVICQTLGEGELKDGTVIRDGIGQLSFVSANDAPPNFDLSATEILMRDRLGAYARPDSLLSFSDAIFAQHVLQNPDRLIVQGATYSCWLLDRRIVGSGWLAKPISKTPLPPRIVFASLKGGVGRSTALAVTAFDLAARGQNVLVVDLDLEAPGLGELLLPPDRTPEFGVIDYLVENGLGGIDQSSLTSFIGTSSLTTGGGGRVDVVPALGRASERAAQNVLPKLARALTEDIGSSGEAISVGQQVSDMIDRLAATRGYDLILVDSRAGLAEISAPAVLGLGGLVLLFGTAQYQTIAGYRSLFAGLKLLATQAVAKGESADWRMMLKPVYAKASLDPEIAEQHASDLYDLFAENIYDVNDEDEYAVNFAINDPSAPHAQLVIPFDPRFADFDPHRTQGHAARAFYEQTFRPFLNELDTLRSDLFGARQSERL